MSENPRIQYFTPYNNFRHGYGTVSIDHSNSFYLQLKTWIKPLVYHQDYSQKVNFLKNAVKRQVHDQLDTKFFYRNFIIDIDVTIDSMTHNKGSFLKIEVTLFLKDFYSYFDDRIKAHCHHLNTCIIDRLNNLEDFACFATKKEAYL